MSIRTPQFRDDLVTSRQETGGTVFYVIKDPVNGRFFRFKEAEHHIARLLDGVRTRDEVRKAVEVKFDAPLDDDTLKGFIKELDGQGLLDKGQAPTPADRPVWTHKNPYMIRLRLFDPEAVLNRLVGPLRFMFTPAFVITALLLILSAATLTTVEWGAISQDFSHMGLLKALLLGWPALLVVGTLHEFAHGLTCKYFGGEVRDMGFLLIYYHPALYCNVSDAWMFPRKAQRLWVMFSGTLLELFVWALATVFWRFTEPGTLANSLALVVIATSGAKALINFNPLIKLDGYYIMSDVLDIPNLRKRAFTYLRHRLRMVKKSEVEPAYTPREGRIFLVYSVVSMLFSIGMLVFMAVQAGTFLMGRLQAWGFVIFLLLLPIIFRYRLRRLLPGGAALPDPAKAKKAIGGWRLMATVASLALAALLIIPMQLRVTGDFSILPAHNADVRSEVDGLVADIRVNEGDMVRKGAVLGHLSSRDYGSQLEQASAQLAEATARLQLLRVGHRPEEVELARKELATARIRRDNAAKSLQSRSNVRGEELVKAKSSVALCEERFRYAQSNLERARKLMDGQVLSQKEFETVAEQRAMRQRELATAVSDLNALRDDDLVTERRDLDMAQSGVGEAGQRLLILRAGSRPEDIAATEAEVARLTAEQRHLSELLALTTIRSPIDGMVTTPQRQLKELPGQYISKGDLVAEVYDISNVTVETAVSEREIEDVKVGQPVSLKARAYPDRLFKGTVTAISTTAHGQLSGNTKPQTLSSRDQGSGAHTLIVRTQIPNPDLLLKPDMTGRAKISCGRRNLLDLMTRRFARAMRVEFWSWW